MRVALLSDIHANEPALRAVLSDLDMESVDLVVCVGDIVGYGPDPEACVSLVRDHADICIAGNHDREAPTPERYGGHPTAGPGLQHTYDQLDDDALAWLADLPERRRLEDYSIIVAHSHPDPAHTDRYVYPDEFQTVGEPADTDLLALGHTHVQGAEPVDGTLVVNPGSVGQPRDGEPDAAYAVVDMDDLSADLPRVEYDLPSCPDLTAFPKSEPQVDPRNPPTDVLHRSRWRCRGTSRDHGVAAWALASQTRASGIEV